MSPFDLFLPLLPSHPPGAAINTLLWLTGDLLCVIAAGFIFACVGAGVHALLRKHHEQRRQRALNVLNHWTSGDLSVSLGQQGEGQP